MIDGHIHVTADLLPYLRQVRCIANADCPAEYAFLREAGLTASVGVHPWKADSTPWWEMATLSEKADVIGEIGLDNVWCNVDLAVQRQMFRRQLALAADLQKPVILHTKGMEREVLETIAQYPNRYLVHWYSHEAYLDAYIALGCYFTVGPALHDPTVAAVAHRAPPDRLLIESDGLEGLAWGLGRKVSPSDYAAAMEAHLRGVAAMRGLSAKELLKRMERNFTAFLNG